MSYLYPLAKTTILLGLMLFGACSSSPAADAGVDELRVDPVHCTERVEESLLHGPPPFGAPGGDR